METAAAVVLVVVIITGAGKPDISHNEPMPDLPTCMAEAQRFLTHQVPEFVGAVGTFAGCKKIAAKDDKS